jgi:hypothetical protein
MSYASFVLFGPTMTNVLFNLIFHTVSHAKFHSSSDYSLEAGKKISTLLSSRFLKICSLKFHSIEPLEVRILMVLRKIIPAKLFICIRNYNTFSNM